MLGDSLLSAFWKPQERLVEALGLGSRWARPLALRVWQDEETQASHLVNVEWT